MLAGQRVSRLRLRHSSGRWGAPAQSGQVTTYGSSRWPPIRGRAAAGLFARRGRLRSAVWALTICATTVPSTSCGCADPFAARACGLVVPTLLSWTRARSFTTSRARTGPLTAGWRARFSHCLLFNPTDARSARYNPLLEVRKGPHEVRDVQNIADILVDPEGALERRTTGKRPATRLLVGAILHVLYAEEEKTLARVATFLSDPAAPVRRAP